MSLEEEAYNIEPVITAAPATGSIGWDIDPPTDKVDWVHYTNNCCNSIFVRVGKFFATFTRCLDYRGGCWIECSRWCGFCMEYCTCEGAESDNRR